MSIISSFTAQPNRVEMLIEFLKKGKKSYTKSELESLFSPQSSAVFKEVYRVIESLSLVEIESDKVKLNIDKSQKIISKVIKKSMVQKEFIQEDKFVYALAWLLSQNSQSLENLKWSGQVNNLVLQDLNEAYEELDLTNNSRWQHFGYWAIYLGFAVKISISGDDYLCPDPTEAIYSELKDIFQDKKELTVGDFFNQLAKYLPLFEFSSIRNEISQELREGLQLPINQLSFSTSLALLRLEQRGVISLEHKSDANSLTLQSSKNRIISHIIYRGES